MLRTEQQILVVKGKHIKIYLIFSERIELYCPKHALFIIIFYLAASSALLNLD